MNEAEPNSFERELAERLQSLRQGNLYRELRTVHSPQAALIQMNGKPLLNFSSNDYLGLANHPEVKEAAIQATERYGAGAGASRLISGSLAPHQELEETLAAWKGTEAALSFVSGYAAALGTIRAILTKGDLIVLDRLVHASLVDAAFQCGARVRVFAHNDLDRLEDVLKSSQSKGSAGMGNRLKFQDSPGVRAPRKRVLIVTESLYSMDGDFAPLREITALKERYGAWLLVDEAHAGGLYGPNRRGMAEALGVADRIEVHMGTLGKAVGSSGGYICGSRALVDYLINSARSFIFSTAPVPAAAGAAKAGVRLIHSDTGACRVEQLWERVRQVGRAFPGLAGKKEQPFPSAIIPIILGEESEAVHVSARLRDHGVFVPAIRYPTVARGQARLRLSLSASHSPANIQTLNEALDGALGRGGR